MKMFTGFTVGAAAALYLSCAMPAMALQDAQHEGNIKYITGGIGEHEEQDLHSEKKDYPLHVINEGRNGAFVGGEHITIRDKKGDNLLSVDGGPLFYAALPPGKYKVESQVKGQTQSKPVTVALNKPVDLRFIW